MDRIFHLALLDEWNGAVANGGSYERSTIGRSLAEEGFVHCSTASQVATTAQRFYAGRGDVLVLEIDPSRLEVEVRHEDLMATGEEFPHVYGPVPLSAVVDVVPLPAWRRRHRLRTERNLWFTTVRPDGRPHVAPVWFLYLDRRFWVGTGAASVKVRNLRAHPSVSLALESGDAPMVAEGSAELVGRPFPDDVVAAMIAKYDWDLRVAEDDDVGTVALVRVDVTRWLLGDPG